MLWLTDFFTAHIIEIYFVYGLGFFILGLSVALESSRTSALPLARATPWLAGFGLLHALAEWIDMLTTIAETTRGATSSLLMEAAGIGVELVSFMWLLRFGCELWAQQDAASPPASAAGQRYHTFIRHLVPIVIAVYIIGLGIISLRTPVASVLWLRMVDVWTSYGAGIPAFAVTIGGLIVQARSFRARAWPEMSREMTGAAIAFFWYALFDSLFVPKAPFPPASILNSTAFIEAVGIPIEIFRAANALAIAFFFVRALRRFAAEDRRRLQNAIATEQQLQSSAEKLNRELREAAKEMSELYEQLRQRDEVHSHLLNRVVRAQEEERRRVARDLHDGVGQTLSGLAAGLAALESRSETPGSTFRQQLVDMKMYAMQSVEELHRVIADLRPSLLDDLGLVAALRWYARQYTETLRLAVSVEVQGHIGRLPPETEIVLFRIAQEALANVVRHARANHATVKLTLQGARVLLQIVDDGIGFDPQKAFAESGNARPWGLLGMQERAALVGGSVVIESQPWAGAKVTVEIPVPEHAPQGGRE